MLAEHGAIVYIAARNEKAGNSLITTMKEKGYNVHFIPFDAQKKGDYTQLIETAVQQEGRLNILVNNYGSTDTEKDKDLLGGDTEAFFDIVQTNIQSVYLTCKHAIPYMMPTGGSIINISSIAAIIPDLSRLAYGVSKAAIDWLTKNIALQYARYNIRCNAILPGLIATEAAMENMSPKFRELFLKHVPLENVRHTSCYTSFLQRIQAKAR